MEHSFRLATKWLELDLGSRIDGAQYCDKFRVRKESRQRVRKESRQPNLKGEKSTYYCVSDGASLLSVKRLQSEVPEVVAAF